MEDHGSLETPCLVWTRGRTFGYGALNAKGHKYAHRLAWEIYKGAIPPGMFVCHIDDHNRLCCNVDHLYLGTREENIEDKVRLGNNTSKLTPQQVIEIREKYASKLHTQDGSRDRIRGRTDCGEQDRAEGIMGVGQIEPAAAVTEKQFMQQVIELARVLGFKVYHTHDSRRSQSGWPDLAMVKTGRLVLAELKSGAWARHYRPAGVA